MDNIEKDKMSVEYDREGLKIYSTETNECRPEEVLIVEFNGVEMCQIKVEALPDTEDNAFVQIEVID
jgi:hypothetical protein